MSDRGCNLCQCQVFDATSIRKSDQCQCGHSQINHSGGNATSSPVEVAVAELEKVPTRPMYEHDYVGHRSGK
uniref:Metallothionein n=1 Tax=Globodera rostochiensis TaxID=31243 RepID=A0A914HKJ9_GLORO